MPKTQHAVIWDFNGTLVDDLDLVVRTVNSQLSRRGLLPLSVAEYRDVFGFPVEEYYRRIGVDFAQETMADLSADFFAEYAPALRACTLYPGAKEALERLRRIPARQFVLSAMEEGMLQEMIRHLGVHEHFEAIYGLGHQEADSKVARARELMSDYDIEPSTALLVGDTLHDAEVARAIGATPVLVAQGHQSPERLQNAGCRVYESIGALALDPPLPSIEQQPKVVDD